MTPTQKEKLKAKRLAHKVRERARIERRKAKRAAKAAPRKALAEWAAAVKAKFGNCCAVCGATKYINAHHVLDRFRYPQLKLEVIGGVALCPIHHKWGTWSAHRNPVWWIMWLRANLPSVWEWAKAHVGKENETAPQKIQAD
jgi:hypothetical protein